MRGDLRRQCRPPHSGGLVLIVDRLDKSALQFERHLRAKIIQLDPWNRVEAMREGRETDAQYIERSLRQMHSFANDLGCHVQIIAHPAKMDAGMVALACGAALDHFVCGSGRVEPTS